MSVDLEVTQIFLDLCQVLRTSNEIASKDYRDLMRGLLICTLEELEEFQQNQSTRLQVVLTRKQIEALEALQRDLQATHGLYAYRLRAILADADW